MESKVKFKPNLEHRLMDQVREVLRCYHYAYRTEQSYCSWIVQYIKFYGGKTHPKDMGKNEVERFLSYLSETPKGKRTCYWLFGPFFRGSEIVFSGLHLSEA